MFIRDLKAKIGRAHRIVPAQVRLPVRLGHRDAKELFATPLNIALAAAALGSVMDCTLRKRASGEVIGVDLFLGLTRHDKSALETVARILEGLSAPCGSSIRLSDATGMPMMFGRAEGVELSIDTAGNPDAAARRDFAVTCREEAEKTGVNRGWTETAGRTRFYFYGEDIRALKRNLTRVLDDHPELNGVRLRRLA